MSENMKPADRAAVARATLEQWKQIASRLQTARSFEEVTQIYDQLDAVLDNGLSQALGCSVAEIKAAVAQGLEGVNRLLREKTS